VPFETTAVPPTETFPLMSGKMVFVGAALAVGMLNVIENKTENKTTKDVFETGNLFMTKSFHPRRDLVGNATANT
jgi:predicted RecA/RadA family phage recombinase